MLVLAFRFLAGRYHATPWDHQVNEGLVEWPPAPWRLLRALLATWYSKAHEEISADLMRQLITQLASALPSYDLPPATVSHTRHYMPLEKGTTKIFDAFACLDKEDRLIVRWPQLTLPPEQQQALMILLSRIGYLGRAEAWVEATILPSWDGKPNARPIQEAGATQDEVIRLLAPLPHEQFESWRRTMIDTLNTHKLAEKQRSKKPPKELSKKAREATEEELPSDLFDALTTDTADNRKAGWSQPPGSQWVEYTRPRGALKTTVPARSRRKQQASPRVARYAVASQVPPRLTQGLSVAERVHQALVKHSDNAPVFVGREPDGTPLQGHTHAYILPEGQGSRGTISTLTLFAQMGFDRHARRALDRLSKVWGHGGHELQLVLLGVGQPEDFAGLREEAGQCALLADSKTWISRTPFIPTRHPKTFRNGRPKLDERGLQIGSPAHDLLRLLQQHGFPEPTDLSSCPHASIGDRQESWLNFQTQRKRGKGRRTSSRGYGFRLTFSEPVSGPIALGYGAHFGLGLFVPEVSEP